VAARRGRIAVRKPVRIRPSSGNRHGMGARAIERESSEPEILGTDQMGPAGTRIGDRSFGEASEQRRQSEGARAGTANRAIGQHRQRYRLVQSAATDGAPARCSLVSIMRSIECGMTPYYEEANPGKSRGPSIKYRYGVGFLVRPAPPPN
jgi:hypothetical protein